MLTALPEGGEQAMTPVGARVMEGASGIGSGRIAAQCTNCTSASRMLAPVAELVGFQTQRRRQRLRDPGRGLLAAFDPGVPRLVQAGPLRQHRL
jgi:hypothetical protein